MPYRRKTQKRKRVKSKRKNNEKLQQQEVNDNSLIEELRNFICPITKEIMVNPVITEEGHTYEEKAIKDWLNIRCTNPVTGSKLKSNKLLHNFALKNTIDDYIKLKKIPENYLSEYNIRKASILFEKDDIIEAAKLGHIKAMGIIAYDSIEYNLTNVSLYEKNIKHNIPEDNYQISNKQGVIYAIESSNSNDPRGLFVMGFLHEVGIPIHGINKDYIKSIEYYEQAFISVNHNNKIDYGDIIGNSMRNLGRIYFNGGWGVDKDHKIAVQWLLKSSYEGDEMGTYYLGDCYYNGYGIKKDFVKARECFTSYPTSIKFWEKSQIMLGIMLVKGEGGEVNINEGVRCWDNVIHKSLSLDHRNTALKNKQQLYNYINKIEFTTSTIHNESEIYESNYNKIPLIIHMKIEGWYNYCSCRMELYPEMFQGAPCYKSINTIKISNSEFNNTHGLDKIVWIYRDSSFVWRISCSEKDVIGLPKEALERSCFIVGTSSSSDHIVDVPWNESKWLSYNKHDMQWAYYNQIYGSNVKFTIL